MLDLQLPWWEFIVRGTIVYVTLLVLVRLSGKRTVGQFTPFDLVVVLLLSEAVSDALSGGDESLAGGLIVAATLVVLNVGLAYLTSHSGRAEQFLEGKEVLLGRNGVIYEDVCKRNRISVGDVEKTLRENDCMLKEMRCAFLEADGSISVLKK
ncbi:MAG TPA: YetF domain-containing protein [Ramlibacter sp.]|nr:YetF domain-containing protein [Ramlibacter sp.]